MRAAVMRRSATAVPSGAESYAVTTTAGLFLLVPSRSSGGGLCFARDRLGRKEMRPDRRRRVRPASKGVGRRSWSSGHARGAGGDQVNDVSTKRAEHTRIVSRLPVSPAVRDLFVGREAELGRLVRALDRAIAHDGRLV